MPEGSRTPNAGDLAQIRIMAEQAADIALTKHVNAQPTVEKQEIPPILKTAGAIVSAILVSGICALAFWIVTTLNEMQLTVARIDERQQSQAGDADGRFQEVDRRITRLEAYHAEGSK